MNGYVLYGDGTGAVTRFEAHRASREALRRVLDDAVPQGQFVLGVVLGPREVAHLEVLPQAS
jgi:hypothetical protein